MLDVPMIFLLTLFQSNAVKGEQQSCPFCVENVLINSGFELYFFCSHSFKKSPEVANKSLLWLIPYFTWIVMDRDNYLLTCRSGIHCNLVIGYTKSTFADNCIPSYSFISSKISILLCVSWDNEPTPILNESFSRYEIPSEYSSLFD